MDSRFSKAETLQESKETWSKLVRVRCCKAAFFVVLFLVNNQYNTVHLSGEQRCVNNGNNTGAQPDRLGRIAQRPRSSA